MAADGVHAAGGAGTADRPLSAPGTVRSYGRRPRHECLWGAAEPSMCSRMHGAVRHAAGGTNSSGSLRGLLVAARGLRQRGRWHRVQRIGKRDCVGAPRLLVIYCVGDAACTAKQLHPYIITRRTSCDSAEERPEAGHGHEELMAEVGSSHLISDREAVVQSTRRGSHNGSQSARDAAREAGTRGCVWAPPCISCLC